MLLPPTDEIGGGGHAWQGDMHDGRGPCVAEGRGACVAEGFMHGGGMCEGETATEVGGTHPTGIHSCSSKLLPKM